MLSRTLLAVGLSAVSAVAQELSAHPQETLTNGNGNLVPFGVTSTGSFAEGRTQILVPARELPSGAAVLLGIEVHCQGNATLNYAALTIEVSPTLATSLVGTFANNVQNAPTAVLQATGLSITYASNAFTPIVFTSPYVHDGFSGMLIEIRKQIQPAASYPFATMSSSSSPPRVDRPPMIYAFGGVGSGAAQSPSAQVQANSIVYRLRWAGTPTVRNRSDTPSGGNQYGLGSVVTLTLNGPGSNLYALAAALGYLPIQLPVPGWSGALRLDNPVLLGGGLLDPSGAAVTPVVLPGNPAVVGAFLVYQMAAIDPASVAIALSNCSDHFVNN